MSTYEATWGQNQPLSIDADSPWEVAGLAAMYAWEKTGQGELPPPSVWVVRVSPPDGEVKYARFLVETRWLPIGVDQREAQFLVLEMTASLQRGCLDREPERQTNKPTIEETWGDLHVALYPGGQIMLRRANEVIFAPADKLYDFIKEHF